tara:strand:+ start:46425 stop:47285 length:861 start_codon:yes stop_codon:yes gene_type:complete
MDKYIAQGAGFPADNDFLMFIQSIIGEVSQLSGIGGTNYILKGCAVTGGNVSNGWMVLNGEIVRFTGGVLGTQVTIIEAVSNGTYLEDINPADGQGDSKQAYFVRTAQFGNTGTSTINWASLERVTPLIELQRAVTPVGGIIMYSGALNAMPSGWFLCDGTNGTPDLGSKFIVGYDAAVSDYNAIGKQGGLEEVSLTANQNGQHTHTGGTNSAGAHTHSTTGYSKNSQSVDNGGGAVVADSEGNSPNTGSAGAHSHTITMNNSGQGEAHENRPPFYTLAFIQYKGV